MGTTWVRHGEEAFDVLVDAVTHLQHGDPLAPVTVVTPSPAVATTVRRAIARRLGGLVGVRFADLGGVAEEIAARHLSEEGIDLGVDRELVTTAVRVVLAGMEGRFSPIAHHRTTWESIARVVIELASIEPDARSPLATAATDLIEIHDRVAAMIPVGARTAVARLATALVREARADLGSFGPIVLHLPDRLPSADRELVAALDDATSVTALLGTAGRSADDVATAHAFSFLGATAPASGATRPAPTLVFSANDVDDEVRSAVRRLLAQAEQGVAWDRMALVHPSGPPYARMVEEILRDAGIPSSSTSTTSLGQGAAGRVLLGVLDVATSGFGRQEVVDLWSTGVVVDHDHRILPFAQLDRSSRYLGIIGGGPDAWHRAIHRRADPAARDVESGTAIAVAMGDAIDTLAGLVEGFPTGWDEVAEWAHRVLDALCGRPANRPHWPEHELDADAAIRTALGRLASLERVEPCPPPELVRSTIRTVLDAPAPRRGRLGHGMLVTTLDRPPVVPLDVVAVVGLVEGHAPRRVGDDALLGDELREGVGLETAADRAAAQQRAFHATLASSRGARIISFARNDQRSGRAQVPSRWLIAAVHDLSGSRPDTEALMAGEPVAGVELVPSLDASLRATADGPENGVVALHADEHVLAELTVAGALDDHPIRGLPAVAAAEATIRARRSSAFTRHDGDIEDAGIDVMRPDAVLSPTSLETYATCPRKWFFRHVLGLGDPDRPEEIERIQPTTRGTLVHRVLERFFDEQIGAGTVPPPGTSWSDAAQARLQAVAAEECASFEAMGLTGHPRWWAHDRAEIGHLLAATLDVDVALRAALGVQPVHVELSFGRDGIPPLEIDLPSGRVVRLAGQVDRVDVGPGRVAIWDYKHASPKPYEVIRRERAKGGDPLDHGTRLQLVVYGLAAQAQTGVDQVHASYWFVKPGTEGTVIGYPVDDALRDRFVRTLELIVDGIVRGRFPGRPGEYQWHRSNFEHCTYCDFDRICPGDRDEQWERVRFDPALRAYDRMVTEGTGVLVGEDE